MKNANQKLQNLKSRHQRKFEIAFNNQGVPVKIPMKQTRTVRFLSYVAQVLWVLIKLAYRILKVVAIVLILVTLFTIEVVKQLYTSKQNSPAANP